MKLHYFFNLSFISFITNMICFNSVSSFGFISKLSNMLRAAARSVRMNFLALSVGMVSFRKVVPVVLFTITFLPSNVIIFLDPPEWNVTPSSDITIIPLTQSG